MSSALEYKSPSLAPSASYSYQTGGPGSPPLYRLDLRPSPDRFSLHSVLRFLSHRDALALFHSLPPLHRAVSHSLSYRQYLCQSLVRCSAYSVSWLPLTLISKPLILLAMHLYSWRLPFLYDQFFDIRHNHLQNGNFISRSELLAANGLALQLIAGAEPPPSYDETMIAVHQNPEALQFASADYQRHRSIVEAAVTLHGSTLQFAAPELKDDPFIVERAVVQNGLALEYASIRLRNTAEIVLKAVENNGLALQFASTELQNTRSILLQAVRSSGYVLHLPAIAPHYQRDREIALASGLIQFSGPFLVSDGLEADLLQALEADPFGLESLPDTYRNDRRYVEICIRKNGQTLEFASSQLRNDLDLATQAVQNDPMAYQYVSPTLRLNRDILYHAVSGDGNLLRHLPDPFVNDREIVAAGLRENGLALRFVSQPLKSDRELVEIAMNQFPRAFTHASDVLKRDTEFALKAVEMDPKNYEDIAPSLQRQREFLFLAVRDAGFLATFPFGVNHHSPLFQLQNDVEFVMEAVRWHGMSISFASEQLRDREDIATLAVSNAGLALQFVSDRLRDDYNVVMAAVHQTGMALRYAGERMRNDWRIVLSAVSRAKRAIEFCGDEYRALAQRGVLRPMYGEEYVQSMDTEPNRDNNVQS